MDMSVTITGFVALYIFLLAAFAGYEIIGRVPAILHTPLMSGANAISGIAVIGALIVTGQDSGMAGSVLGVLAVALATINVVGGFMVTDRMLRMFRRAPRNRD